MPITRKFIDWRQPILATAADWLVEHYTRGNTFCGDDVLVVLPGRRAVRLLRDMLVQRAEQRKLVLLPPSMTTIGNLPEQLYQPQKPFAGQLLQRMAWVEAVRDLPRDDLQRIVVQPPDTDDVDRWFELGTLLWRQHRELAGDGLDFADVAGEGGKVGGRDEQNRWQLLARIQRSYLDRLSKLNLWDRQTARLVAVEANECGTRKDIVLVATADMNRTMRQMLQQVADRVVCLVHAPEELANRFDPFGCLDPAAWQDVDIPLDAAKIQVVGGPAQQATAVAEALAGYEGRYAVDQITIGVPDEGLVPQLQRTLGQMGVRTRYGVGRSISQTLPYRLLDAVAAYAAHPSYTAMAALVRHADVHAWLVRQGTSGDWLTELDNYHADHLPSRLAEWLGREEDSATIRAIGERIEKAVAPLRGEARTLSDWVPAVHQVLVCFYGDVQLDRDVPAEREALAAFKHIQEVLFEFQSLPASIATRYEASAAVRLFLDELGKQTIPPPPDADAVELRGWLELPTDPAPALIVTSLCEGLVPESLNADLFLPNTLRHRLRILDNQQRYARDAYALNVLAASRERLTLIAGRFTGQGDPLTPSRLLFATDPLTAARRARLFFDEKLSSREPPPRVRPDAPARSAFEVSRPVPLAQPLDYMNVTAFRAYLACPYRFYLSYVLKLSSQDDTQEEMGAATFGVLIHDVLRHFGESPVRDSTREDEIAEFLFEVLTRRAAAQFGRDPLPAVLIQLQHIRDRLQAFAHWQADWRGQGWRIEHIENEEGADRFDLKLEDGRTMKVGGRIDRIDRHEQSREYLVLDYKTSDTARQPEKAHCTGDKWTDLQLPLYRHLTRAMGIDGNIRLGYINLPKSVDQVGVREAAWTDAELDEADAVARHVAGKVLDQQFWPPADQPPYQDDELAALCQLGVFERRLADDERRLAANGERR